MKARLLDMGHVSPLRSQSIYHAVTDCMRPDSDVAITLMRPNDRYVSIGYFQEAEREVDLAYCEANGLPVIRRHVGGGAVLLDGNQLFFHVIVPAARAREFGLPAALEDRFSFLARPPIAAYNKLGVEATFRPINDIQVHGRKIGGTGVGEIGDGMVFAGSMMFDFDTELMSRVLKISDEKLRDKVAETMDAYMTTLAKELGTKPPSADVAEALANAFEESYGLELEPAALTPEELDAVSRWDRELSDPAWLHLVQWDPGKWRETKIAAHVRFLQAEHKAPGGMMRVSARAVDDRIDTVLLSGDVPVTPNTALSELAARFEGAALDTETLQQRAEEAFASGSFEMAGVQPDDVGTLFSKMIQ